MTRAALDRHAGALGVALFLVLWELAARLVWRDPRCCLPPQALARPGPCSPGGSSSATSA